MWESVNTRLHPELKHELLSGDLTRFKCRKCGALAEVLYPLLYHDMEKQVMIWLVNSVSDIRGAAKSPYKLTKGYRSRIVLSRRELVEKIELFDADFDDRVIEAFKLIMRMQLPAPRGDERAALFYTGSSKSGKTMSFSFVGRDEVQEFEIERSVYDEFAESIAERLSSPQTQRAEWARIDQQFAAQLLGDVEF